MDAPPKKPDKSGSINRQPDANLWSKQLGAVHTGEPVLFDPQCFEIIDSQEPDFWLSKFGNEGERYSYPPGWGVPGFFEDWHDGVKVIRQIFSEQLSHWYPAVSHHAR